MNDPRIAKLAHMLVNYSINVQPGENVVIRSWTLAEPLINAVCAEIYRAGGYPHLLLKFPETDEILFNNASDEQLQHTSELEALAVEHLDAVMLIRGEGNTKSLSNINPHRIMLSRKAERPLMQKLMQRGAEGSLKLVSTLFPTQAYAQDADMGLIEFEDFVYRACMPNLNDPIGYWQGVAEKQARLIAWLEEKDHVRILGPDTELELSIKGRTWMNSVCKANVPDGEIYTAPIEDSAEGHVFFSYPVIYHGRQMTGVTLWFEDGKVIRASAEKNEAYLLEALETDDGAKYLGEFAIGTNQGIDRFVGQILFDEKIAGSFHLALGNAYPQTGGTNQSAIHWDMICDLRQGGEIWVDGELFYENGHFVPVLF
jgi:aminopeptidase